jgi:small subunit ribosomal protein S17
MKLMKGRVVSNKMTKTAVVLVEGTKINRMYRKSYVYSNKYLVDDSFGVKIGDIVQFEKCAPISKRKHWKIVKVLGRDIVAVETEIMKEVASEAIEEVMPEEVAEVETEAVEVESETEVAEVATDEKPVKKSKKGAK